MAESDSRQVHEEGGGWRRLGLRVAPAVAIALIGAFGVLRMLAGVASVHNGRTGGDPYTYLQFSRNLSQGRFFLSTPVTDAVAAHGRTAERPRSGATWNTDILPDGRTAFTVAPGYPLVLAGAWRLGGAWLATHLNLALLGCMLLLLAAVAAGGTAPSRLAVGATAALLLPLADPRSLAQFSYAWREPLYAGCILGAALAVAAYAAGRDRRILWAAAFLAGWACSVKEACAVYLPVLAVAVVAARPFRREPRKARLIVSCAVAFLLGVAPLLLQNTLTTGLPWVSLQSIRETRNYSLVETGAGLSAGNVGSTLRLYAKLYLGQGLFFSWPALALAAAGGVLAQRRLAGRLLLGLFVMHVALYVQWRNADPRLMYVALLPYAAFLAEGVQAVFGLAARLAARSRLAAALCAVPVLVLCFWPRPWLQLPASERVGAFTCRDALRLAAAVEAAVPSDGVVLANRAVRDVVGALTPLDVVRWQDLVNFAGADGARDILEQQRARTRVFFLDNVDRDPSHSHLVDWRHIDTKQLSSFADLVPVAAFPSSEYHLGALLDAPALRLLELRPQTTAVHRASVPLPPAGAAALRIETPVPAADLAVTLDGAPADLAGCVGGFIPLPPAEVPASALSLVCRRADGAPLPAAFSATAVSWDQDIGIAFGADARPDDAPWIVARDPRERVWGCRLAADGYRLRLPVRQREDVFTCAGLLLNRVRDPEHVKVVSEDTATVLAEGMTGNTIWFPLPAAGSGARRFVGAADIRVDGLPAEGALLLRAVLSQAWRRLALPDPEGARGVVVRGRAFADPPAGRAPTLRLRWGTQTVQAEPDPADERWICAGMDAAGDGGAVIHVEGGGVVDPRCAVIGRTLAIDPAEAASCAALAGFHPPERDERAAFAWSRGASAVWVPLSSGCARYRLRITVSSGLPAPSVLDLSLEGASPESARVEVPAAPGAREQVFDVANPRNGLVRLWFRTAPWTAAERLRSATDRRELGLRLYRLEWTPVESGEIAAGGSGGAAPPPAGR